MSDLRTRAATPADLDTVLAFWKVAAEGTSISDDRDGIERLMARDAEALILAERGGVLAGTVIAGFDGWRCHLYRLAVHPDHRRQGIAGALLRAAEERFLRVGGRRSDAMVLDRNEPAHPAWRAAGYAPEPQWSRWVKPLRREAAGYRSQATPEEPAPGPGRASDVGAAEPLPAAGAPVPRRSPDRRTGG